MHLQSTGHAYSRQSLYCDVQIVKYISGRIGDGEVTASGVKQGCLLSPTLFGVLVACLTKPLRVG